MTSPRFDHLVLDWNGTLIDDLALAVQGVNHAGLIHGVAPIDTTVYRYQFGFPICDFYRRLGFEVCGDSFDQVIATYLRVFNAAVGRCMLHAGATELIAQARAAGASVSILSASHRDILTETLATHGLLDHFDHVFGLGDEQAVSKHELADYLDAHLGRPRQRVLMVGDTDHDVSVAAAQDWQMAIVTHGHQSSDHFDPRKLAVFNNLWELLPTVRQRALIRQPTTPEVPYVGR